MSSTSQSLRRPSTSSIASKRSPRKPVAETLTSLPRDTDALPDADPRNGPYESVWDALEQDLGERERMKMLSYLIMAVEKRIKAEKWTQKQAAEIMGVTQPRVSDLMRHKIDLFSIDSLVSMAGKAGLQLSVGMKPPKA